MAVKAGSILICPNVNLHALPDMERDVLRRFWTEYVRGIDADHDKEWRRLGRDLFGSEPGECIHLYRAEGRDGPFHRRHRAVLSALFEHQDRYPNVDALHDYLKLKCWHVEWKDGKPFPATTNFDECSEARMRRFNRRLTDYIREPVAMRHFWPHLSLPLRREMVEMLLKNPSQHEEHA